MASDNLKQLMEEKARYRLAMRNEYLKKITNPHTSESAGHLFDPAVQRFLSLKTSKIDHFKETPLTIAKALAFVVLPIGFTIYILKKHRDEKEALYRSGKVAYKDRPFKFI